MKDKPVRSQFDAQRRTVLGTSANRSTSLQIRKLRTQGFGLRICGPISYRKHLRICGKKMESTANPQMNNITEIVSAISKKYVFTRGGVEDTRLEVKAKDTKKSKAKDTKKSKAKAKNSPTKDRHS